MPAHRKLIEIISACGDPGKLRNWIANARREGAKDLENAATQRLIEI